MRNLKKQRRKGDSEVEKYNEDLYIHFLSTDRFPEITYELKSKIRAGILGVLSYENFPYPAEVSVTFCDEKYIKDLNKTYRGIEKETDVLSFPLYEKGEFTYEECAMGASLGDIVISIPRAREQAIEIGNSFVKEATFLAIHSTLHLLGYDHELGPAEEEAQCLAQKEIISKIKF
jgi:probable rRNA maturation factor